MNDQKNMILAIVFSAVILFGWHIFYEQPRLEAERAAQQAQQAGQAGQEAQQENAPTTLENGENLGILPDISAVLKPEGAVRTEILESTARLPFDNGRIKGSVNLQGGHIDDVVLQDYFTDLDRTTPITLFQPDASERPYFADYGWIGRGGDFPDRRTLWRIAEGSPEILTPQNPVTLFWQNAKGVRFEKTLSLDSNFLFAIDMRIVNGTGENIEAAPYGLVLRTDEPDVVDFYILHEGLLGVIDGSLEEIDYEDAGDFSNGGRDSVGGWLGITDKYWLAAVIPEPQSQVTMDFQSKTGNKYPLFQSHFVRPLESLAPQDSQNYRAYLYVGAKETFLLDAYEARYGFSNFDLAVDFGWFYFLTKPIYQAIHYLNNYLGNFGLAILALTVLVKIVLLPLAYKSYASMSRMKLLQPRVMELREQFGDDKNGLRQAMMDLYRAEKVNPMSGCLPILLQIPVFFSLYKVLFVTIEMRHAPFYGWIHDLSVPDPLGILTLFGLIDWQVPGLLGIINIGLWPIIMGITMWLQQKLNPTPPDPVQARIFGMMPFLFTFLLASFPAGLVIYWAWNNALSIAQQWFIMRIVARRQERQAVAAEVAEPEGSTAPAAKKESAPVNVSKVKNKKKRRGKRR